ncbi:MAG: Coenzyme F420 hydrogenase/dehydrogenase, beta subunit C-terminal domain [Bacteroidales bacterium]|nr:Coenzyme F420 hydrogenase/dehydrogenase, beta subunit C-terminal domain [Bacteroidales bacterium]HPL34116.1 Coenzyme F420 hydrogenase/dehydrogenase, beta subunit C-terminal domain [Bacteroidales bacterium]HQI64095.1 Coenzyme F420 hydrogenase/dehydrogenase, beta subunit C-terminal domain [Bacteroidales bacterium]
MRANLCNRCGTCVGLSNGKILFQDREGKYRPKIISPLTQEEAATIWSACSGHEFHFPEFNQWLFASASHFNRLMGSYENLYIGHANDQIVRSNAGSGGILSALLIYLLEKGEIQGAVTLRMSKEKPWLTEPFIATTKEEILESAQSKYVISSVNEILPQIAKFDGKLAYVGLPGQVQAIRKLQKMKHPSVDKILYIFGPFYGNTLHVSSIRSFLAAHKEKDLTSIEKIYFRYGEWPGRMRIEMKNGRIMELPKFHANYLIPFHILKNSLLCTDLTNEFTDISGGDAWAPVYEERGKGFSLVIARSKQGQNLLEEMANQHIITLWPIAEEEAIKMHSHGYDLKKRGTFIRMQFRSLLGLKNPDYGYKISGFSLGRYMMEILIDLLFLLFGTKPARYMADHIPQKTMGYIFENARKYWKKATYSTKREKL